MKRAYTCIPEGQVHYRTEGEGPVVLLLHQACTSSLEYARVIPFLSKTYRAIAMDTLGHGESDQLPQQYEIPDYAKSVVSFLDSLGIDKASVVGHHTGAYIGVELAATYPERVDKLILSGCPFYPEVCLRFTPDPEELFRPMEVKEDGSHMLWIWETKTFQIASRIIPLDIRYEKALEYLKAGPRVEETHMAAARYDARPKLPLIKCPTLLLSGRLDVFVSLLEDMKKLVPRSRIKIIEGPGSGPALIRGRYQDFAEAVLEFLQKPDV